LYSNFSNDSQNEKEFFDTLSYYFGARKNKFLVKRNVNIKEVITNISDEDLNICKNFEYDVVIYIKKLFKVQPIFVLELDGPEHAFNKETIMRDKIKQEISSKYNIKIIRFSNRQTYDYRFIFNALKFQFKGKGDYFDDFIC
jgi:hypothetical protein